MTGLVVLAVAVVAAVGFGLYRSLTDGAFRRPVRRPPHTTARTTTREPVLEHAPPTPAALLADAVPGVRLGERATLLQFSSAFCAPCRVTRRTLAEVAELVPGVTHVEVDAEAHLDLVRALQVVRTPTTLVLDPSGSEVTRAAGAPRREQVLNALADLS